MMAVGWDGARTATPRLPGGRHLDGPLGESGEYAVSSIESCATCATENDYVWQGQFGAGGLCRASQIKQDNGCERRSTPPKAANVPPTGHVASSSFTHTHYPLPHVSPSNGSITPQT